MSVAGVQISDTNAVGINADGNMLTIGTGGITVNSGAGAVTVNPLIALNGAQTWTNNSSNKLTIGGAVSGALGSPLTISGSGTTVLSGPDSYADATIVSSSSTLIVSGSLSGTSSVSVGSGGNVEVDGLVSHSATVAVNSGEIDGTGSVGAIASTGGTVAPGLKTLSTAPGVLTASGAVSLDGASTFSIRLGVASGADSDSLVSGTTVSLGGANLALNLGINFHPQAPGFIYILINGGTTSTGNIVGQFAQGGSITDSLGDTYSILYNVNNLGTAGAGNDVALDVLTSVPESGTWAMLFSGVGLLLLIRRRSGWNH